MIVELTGEQIRVMTDAVQVFEAWREADRTWRHSYRATMMWRTVKGKKYLYRRTSNSQKYIGPQSEETEALLADYQTQRRRLRDRRKRLSAKLKALAPINRAYRLGRLPKHAADVLHTLDAEGLLGTHLHVIGTHSLYAYEAAAGVHFSGDLLATTDIDLLWDTRRKLKLAVLDMSPEGVLGILRKVDKSYARTRNTFRASNDDGFLVDLVRPMEPDEILSATKGIGDNTDLEAAAISGLQWLINAPTFEQAVIAENGFPVRMSCFDPRVFALHKWWVGHQPDREPAKARRDKAQSKAVAALARQSLNLDFSAKSLSALPLGLVSHAKKLVGATRKTQHA